MAEGPATVSLASSDKGAQSTGRLMRLTAQMTLVKSRKTGQLELMDAKDAINQPDWIPLPDRPGLFMFSDIDKICDCGRKLNETKKEKLVHVLTQHCRTDLLVGTPLEGLKWDAAMFSPVPPEEEQGQVGQVVPAETENLAPLDMDKLVLFEVPHQNLTQCTVWKEELDLQLHQIDNLPFKLIQMVPHFPQSKSGGDIDPSQSAQMKILGEVKTCGTTEDAIAVFSRVECFRPGGTCDIKVFRTFFQLHGDIYYYKILMSSVRFLLLLPHKDGRHTYFIISLSQPINLGPTYYRCLVFLFGQEEEVLMELPMSEEELKTKYKGCLTKKLSGPKGDVISKLISVMANRKITGPAQQFLSHPGNPAIECSYMEQVDGYLYLLDYGLIYLYAPCILLHYRDISNVIFSRARRSFEVKTKTGVVHSFSRIRKGGCGKVLEFIKSRNVPVKKQGKVDKPLVAAYEFGKRDRKGKPDANLAKGKTREEDEGKDGGRAEKKRRRKKKKKRNIEAKKRKLL